MNQHAPNDLSLIDAAYHEQAKLTPVLLAAAAGSPSRIYQTRRGTFMILVVGTLALLAVLTVLYVTVGKSDRQTASAVVRSERTKAVPDVFRDYANQVIGDGAVSLYETPKPNQDTLPDNKREFVRKSWDYPSTDWNMKTYQTDATKRSYFKPSGHLSGSTPFLASPTPTWLDFAGTAPPNNRPEYVYKNYKDWGHISNFAPDGAFVNLWNLRPEANFGGFDAPTFRMRTGVGLLTDSFNAVSNSRDFNGSSIRFAAAGLPGNPADLSMRQQWLFREVKLGNDGAVGPDNAAYMPYQYADVDGDGKYDSRIFELREYRDPSSFAFKDLLPQDPNFRWFFAARCVDLSGMVNVNTATDYFEASARGATYSVRAEIPSGVTPAEVNFFRLLTMQDAPDLTGDGSPFSGSYAGFNQFDGPTSSLVADVQNYSRPRTDGLAVYNKDTAYNIGTRSYDNILRSFITNTLRTPTNATQPSLYMPDAATRLARYVNLAGRREGDSPAGSIAVAGGGTVQGLQNTSLFTAADQLELLTYWSCNDPATMSRLEAVMSARENRPLTGSFNAASADRDPLRSNRSLNVERDFTPQAPASSLAAQVAARLQAEIDVRHQITTLSGAREIKAVPVQLPASNSVADLLSSSDANSLQSSAFKRSPQSDLEAALTVVPVANGQKTSDALEIGRTALNDLFTGYADGLMPAPPSISARAEVWRGSPSATIALRNKNRTRFYGYSWYDGPELPLLYSAFMTVNLADMYDTDDVPTMRTVLFNDQFRPELTADFRNAQSASGSPLDEARDHQDTNRKPLLTSDRRGDGSVAGSRAQPWSGWADLKQLDLNNGAFANGRLANTNQYSNSTKAPALNVYGIEATPMITQVATVTVYTDAPTSLLGDADGQPDADGNGFPDGLVTINTDPLDTANSDFVMRVAAFQISNPFEKDITLSANGGAQPIAGGQLINGAYIAIDSEKSFYYLEYAGHFYKLAELRTPPLGTTYDTNGRILRPLIVPAGGSIVVYVLDRPKSDILARMQALSGGAGGMTAAALDGWFQSRFGGSNAFVCEVPEFKPIDVGTPASNSLDPVTGGRVIFTPHDPCGDATIIANSDPRKDPKRNVLLWRAARAENFQGAPTGSAAPHEGALAGANYYPRNSRVNDQLADRFTATTDLDRKYPAGNVPIAGAFASLSESFFDDSGNNNYNTGMTISLFQSSRRPDSPTNAMPIGSIPAWAIKPVVQGSSGVWAVVEDDDHANIAGSPQFGDFQKPVAAHTFMDWFTKTSLPATQMLPQANVAAAARVASPVPRSILLATDEFQLNNNRFANPATGGVSAMRLADLLLPMCIGPFETPVRPNASAPRGFEQILQTYNTSGQQDTKYIENIRDRWFTLSEALSVALGYEQLPDAGASVPLINPQDLAYSTVQTFYSALRGPGTAKRPVHDRGHLVLDDFVPFQDDTQNTAVETRGLAATFNPGGSPADYRVGIAIPPAMNVLEQFSLATTALTDTQRSKPGLVNINTATRMVLDTLPMLAPNDSDSNNAFEWWWTDGPYKSTDIVATLLGYRDRSNVYLRAVTASMGSAATNSRDFHDDSAVNPDDRFNVNRKARADFTQIPAINEDEGFHSVGELLAVRYRAAGIPADNPSNIDYLGQWPSATARPNNNGSRFGIDTTLHYKNGNPFIDELKGEYDEKLAIANQVFTAASVRSDYFAVYFMVMGYQRSDIDNIKTGEPMVPSVRRRYVMIVDRSNVVKLGDKPRIVAIKEVPLAN